MKYYKFWSSFYRNLCCSISKVFKVHVYNLQSPSYSIIQIDTYLHIKINIDTAVSFFQTIHYHSFVMI